MARRELVIPRYVLWLDGGETTGWALYDGAERQIFMEEIDQFEVVGRKLEAWLSTAGPRTVVGAERYVITPMSARKDPTGAAIQVYGMARWCAAKNGARFAGGQTSSDALSLVKDDWLKAFGWWKPGMTDGHDAARHVVKYLVDRNRLPAHLSERLGTLLSVEDDAYAQS